MLNVLGKVIKEVVKENEFDTNLTEQQLEEQFIKYLKEEGHLEVLIERIKEDVEEMYEGFEPEED